jgi:hypothetical protein
MEFSPNGPRQIDFSPAVTSPLQIGGLGEGYPPSGRGLLATAATQGACKAQVGEDDRLGQPGGLPFAFVEALCSFDFTYG